MQLTLHLGVWEGVNSRCDMENGTVTLTASDIIASKKALAALAKAGFYGRADNKQVAMGDVSNAPPAGSKA